MSLGRKVVKIGGDSVTIVKRRSLRDEKSKPEKCKSGKSVDYIIKLCEIYFEGRCSQTVFRQLFDEYLEKARQNGELGADHASKIIYVAEKLGERGLTELRGKLQTLIQPREVVK